MNKKLKEVLLHVVENIFRHTFALLLECWVFCHLTKLETSLTWTDLDLLERTQGRILSSHTPLHFLVMTETFSDLSPRRLLGWRWNKQVSNTQADSLSSLRGQSRGRDLPREQGAAAAGSMPEKTAAVHFSTNGRVCTEHRVTPTLCYTVRSAVYKPIRGQNSGCGMVNTSNGLWKGNAGVDSVVFYIWGRCMCATANDLCCPVNVSKDWSSQWFILSLRTSTSTHLCTLIHVLTFIDTPCWAKSSQLHAKSQPYSNCNLNP